MLGYAWPTTIIVGQSTVIFGTAWNRKQPRHAAANWRRYCHRLHTRHPSLAHKGSVAFGRNYQLLSAYEVRCPIVAWPVAPRSAGWPQALKHKCTIAAARCVYPSGSAQQQSVACTSRLPLKPRAISFNTFLAANDSNTHIALCRYIVRTQHSRKTRSGRNIWFARTSGKTYSMEKLPHLRWKTSHFGPGKA